MNSSELVAMTTRNISNALRDYKAHTSPTSVLNNVSDCFIERLAIDGIAAIKELAPKVYRSNKKKIVCLNQSTTCSVSQTKTRQRISKIVRSIR